MLILTILIAYWFVDEWFPQLVFSPFHSSLRETLGLCTSLTHFKSNNNCFWQPSLKFIIAVILFQLVLTIITQYLISMISLSWLFILLHTNTLSLTNSIIILCWIISKVETHQFLRIFLKKLKLSLTKILRASACAALMFVSFYLETTTNVVSSQGIHTWIDDDLNQSVLKSLPFA